MLYEEYVMYLWRKSIRGVIANDPIADCKFQGTTFGRKEAIAKPWLDGQESDTKAYQADEVAKGIEVPKGNRNLNA